MARRQRLKVYRTPIGFHDAYVAAPSQKAALAAWGSEVDLFSRGVAEVVDDVALTREPLAEPGTVIRRSRGSADEHLAALPPDPPRRPREPADAHETGDRAASDDQIPPRTSKKSGGSRRPAAGTHSVPVLGESTGREGKASPHRPARSEAAP